jgi:hypothetical protein
MQVAAQPARLERKPEQRRCRRDRANSDDCQGQDGERLADAKGAMLDGQSDPCR